MTNNNDQLSDLYRQQARDKAPEHLNESVLNLAAKKSEQLAEKNTKTHSFWRLIAFEKSHWLGAASACCVMILSLSILVPMTQTPLQQSPSFENSHATVSASERNSKKRSELRSPQSEVMFDEMVESADRPEMKTLSSDSPLAGSALSYSAAPASASARKATATPSKEQARVSAQKRVAQQQRSKPTLSSAAPMARAFSAPPTLLEEEIAAEKNTSMSDSALTNPPLETSAQAEQSMPAVESRRTEAQWLEIIDELVTAKDFEAARLAAKDFSRAFPDYEQPDNWKAWLHKE